MELLIKSTKEILNDKITMSQRGILITILLVKEDNPKLTLAKFKASSIMRDCKKDLVALHKAKFIKWSGYNYALKSLEKKEQSPDIVEAINFMNKLYRRGFDPNSESTVLGLRGRLKEHNLDTIKKVIANRYSVWKDNKDMSIHLNPTTIFRPSKFPKYLEEAMRTDEGISFVNIDEIGIEDGDELTFENSKNFADRDTFSIKVYQCDADGNKRGNGMVATRYGNDLKRMIIKQVNLHKRGLKEHVYIYISK